jgi:hypothetical protein
VSDTLPGVTMPGGSPYRPPYPGPHTAYPPPRAYPYPSAGPYPPQPAHPYPPQAAGPYAPPAAGPYAAPAGAYQQYQTGAPYIGERVVFDVGRSTGRHLVVGALIGAVLGGPAAVAGIQALVHGQAAGVIMLVFGLALLAMPVVTIVRAKFLFRKRHLVFEAPGLRWEEPRGAPWAVPWSELESVLVHGHVSKGSRSHEPLVVLHLYPADPYFAARHPGMAHLWNTDGRGAYRIPLVFSPNYVPRLDEAMRRFAPDVYSGVAFSVGDQLVPVADRYPGVFAAGG